MMIYLSGRITGNDSYVEDFTKAKNKLIKLGYESDQIKSPLEIMPYKGLKLWKNYMIADIRILVQCDSIYLLKGWRRSKGARLERKIAKGLKLKIMYEK